MKSMACSSFPLFPQSATTCSLSDRSRSRSNPVSHGHVLPINYISLNSGNCGNRRHLPARFSAFRVFPLCGAVAGTAGTCMSQCSALEQMLNLLSMFP